MSFTIQNLDTREGIPGLVIGTLVGQPGDVFTPWFDYSGAIVLNGNELKLGPQFIFDFESKSLLNPSFVTIDGNVNNAGATRLYNLTPTGGFDLVLPIKINGLDDNIQLDITDVDEGVTFTPVNKVNENEYGAVIGTVTPNSPSVFNSVTINGSNGFYSIEGNEIKLKDEYLLNSDGWIDKNPASSFWGANIETGINKDLYLGVGSSGYSIGSNFDNGLGAETTVSVIEQKNILSSTDKISEITTTPFHLLKIKQVK